MMGVYEIINTVNGRSYVGSSCDVKKRWYNHLNMLRTGTHVNPHIQASFNKHGESAFSFCMLEWVVDKEVLLEREQFYLDRAFEVGDTYNIAKDALCPPSQRGVIKSKEHRRKIGDANRGRKFTKEHRRKLGVAKRGKAPWNTGKKRPPMSAEWRSNLSKAGARPYPTFINRKTNEVIPAGINLAKLCRKLELDDGAMNKVMHGKLKHYKGWVLLERDEE